MQVFQWALLLITVALGVFWSFIIQNWLLLFFAAPLTGGGMDFQAFMQIGSSPAFAALWICCIIALLIWNGLTWTARPSGSSQVRRMQLVWWIFSGILVFLGWLSLSTFIVFRWQLAQVSPIEGSPNLFFPVPPGGWIVLMGFVLLDVILLFWLPTLLASPRTYRFVVPGAVTLLGSR